MPALPVRVCRFTQDSGKRATTQLNGVWATNQGKFLLRSWCKLAQVPLVWADGAFASEAECLKTCAHAKWACVQSKDNRPNFAGADGKMCVIDTQGGVCPYLPTCESACSGFSGPIAPPPPPPPLSLFD
jgi:hypothetical protein